MNWNENPKCIFAYRCCGMCCVILSFWGALQLIVMGILAIFEPVHLLEEAEAHEYTSYDDFVSKTKDGYKKLSRNCFISGFLYLISFGLGILSYIHGNRLQLERDIRTMGPDEIVCVPQPLEEPNVKFKPRPMPARVDKKKKVKKYLKSRED